MTPQTSLSRETRAAKPRYLVGLDLGQAHDYTALAIIEQHGEDDEALFHVRHLQRFQLGTPYPKVVTEVSRMLEQKPLASSEVMLAVDGTGVGAAVVDLFRRETLRADLLPVIITGGDSVTCDGGVRRVPKRDLVSVVQVGLQTGRLKIAAALPEAVTLTRELQNFQVKITVSANDTYGAWREGTHDDLVLAVALALWASSRWPVRLEVLFSFSWGGLMALLPLLSHALRSLFHLSVMSYYS